MSLLTVIILLPLATAFIILFIPATLRFAIRLVALAGALATFVAGLLLFLKFQIGVADYQFVQQITWIRSLDISYHVGVDGINIGLVFLAALIGFSATCVSWEIKTQVKEFYF